MARRGTTPRKAADASASYPCADPPPPQKVFELDLYAILGVSIMATEEEIRRSWKKRAFENHPDRPANVGDIADATIRFQTIQHAYNILKDTARRREYDAALLHRLHAEEYLGRCIDLLLTSSGLGLGMLGVESECGYRGSEGIDTAINKLSGPTRRFFLTATVKRTKSYEDLQESTASVLVV